MTLHTGFKGAWLTLWLAKLGARVVGIALPPSTNPSLFDQLDLAHDIDHRVVYIQDPVAVVSVVRETRPDIVFHLAAQSLVLRGYRLPLDTRSNNVMGTVHMLEAWRDLSKPGEPHETRRLALSIERLRSRLGWTPRWSFSRAVRETMEWYRASSEVTKKQLRERSLSVIRDYEACCAQEARA